MRPLDKLKEESDAFDKLLEELNVRGKLLEEPRTSGFTFFYMEDL